MRQNTVIVRPGFVVGMLLCATTAVAQQQAPAIGYMHPAGGRAGSTVDVVLGGYDWTPDIEAFVFAPGVQLNLTGEPSSVIVPEPPYWFGKKARRAPFLMPSETPAKLSIPADTPPGVYAWQVANANGAAARGRFMVSHGRELLEDADRSGPQPLDALPVTVSGQIRKIKEVDQYRFVAPHDGPITLALSAAAINSPLTATIEVHDASGKLIADASDTAHGELRLTFAVKHDQPYVVSVYDVDFRGNRSFVYRLAVSAGPQVVAALPAAGQRGETRNIEFIGFGLASGAARLESIIRPVTFSQNAMKSFAPQLETPFGLATPAMLLVSDLPEFVEAEARADEAMPLKIPSAVTGCLDVRYGTDEYVVAGIKGERWTLELAAQAIGSPLDVALSIHNEEGKELKRSDDLPGTTDAGLEFVVPADGNYHLAVTDSSGHSGSRCATYRLTVRATKAGFRLSGPELINVPLGGTAQLTINVARAGGFSDPIDLRIEGLPAGVTAPAEIQIPAKKNSVKIGLTCAEKMGTGATLLHVSGRATMGDAEVTEGIDPILLAVTMKPPFSIDAEGKNDVTKWPRGTTFPAPVLIQRDEGFAGEIVLEMAAKQGRHRQGINGPELTIPPDVERILYPVFLPEWLETTRTSRMVVNGVAQVPDPEGRVRFLSSKLKTRIGFLPTGALLKIDCNIPELEAVAGQRLAIPLTINRAKGLAEVAQVELVQDSASDSVLAAEPLAVDGRQSQAVLQVTPLTAPDFFGERQITIRATVMQQGHLPVVSETQVLVVWSGAKNE